MGKDADGFGSVFTPGAPSALAPDGAAHERRRAVALAAIGGTGAISKAVLAAAAACSRVMAMAVGGLPAAAVLSVSGRQAAVSQRAASVQGGVRELLEMEGCTGDRGPASIHLNGRYLMQMLNALKGSDSVTIDVAGEAAPLLLTGDGTRALSLLMPMRADAINTAFARDGFNQLRCQPLKAVA